MLPLKSGINTSIEHPGWICLIRLITIAKIGAPPSLRSSRFTLVITACLRFMFLTAWATRSGSVQSISAGFPCLTSQNPHVRVHTSPSIRNVAVPLPQHSPILGQLASSHTVCSSLLRISVFRFWYSSPIGVVTLIHSGRRLGRGVLSVSFIRSREGVFGIGSPAFGHIVPDHNILFHLMDSFSEKIIPYILPTNIVSIMADIIKKKIRKESFFLIGITK